MSIVEVASCDNSIGTHYQLPVWLLSLLFINMQFIASREFIIILLYIFHQHIILYCQKQDVFIIIRFLLLY